MARPRARPRFTLDLAIDPEQVLDCVRDELDEDDKIRGKLRRRSMLLTMRERELRFWSPQLDVQLSDTDDGGTRLAAVFAPHPQIWAVFVTVQILFGFATAASAVWAMASIVMDESPWSALGTLVGCLVGGGLSFAASWVGQSFGADQMSELRAFLDRALERRTLRRRPASS